MACASLLKLIPDLDEEYRRYNPLACYTDELFK